MMPNQWIPPVKSKTNGEESVKIHGTFRRPLRYGDRATRCCIAELKCEDPSCLQVTLTGELPANGVEESEVLEQVKTITICNVRWKQSLVMNRQLCNVASSIPGSFPSPWDVARFSPEHLQKKCSLGYRGDRVRRLADSFISGSLTFDFDTIQHAPTTKIELPISSPIPPSLPVTTTPPTKKRRTKGATATGEENTKRNDVFKKVLSLYGFGRFAAENVMQLMGFFDVDVFDSETARFMREAYGVTNKDVNRVWEAARRHFEQYRPFQFLAYWFELWKLYESSVGTPSLNWTAENAYFVDGAKRL
ncbi:hypothetical protein Emed_001072 [Eimeria media]